MEYKSGFVGCMRGLRVNGVLVDLRGLIQRGQFQYGLAEGCVGKCSSNPCFHGGTCIEGYSGYTCDCSYTPWRGWMCGRGKAREVTSFLFFFFCNLFIFKEADRNTEKKTYDMHMQFYP